MRVRFLVVLFMLLAMASAAQVNLMGDHEGINLTCWGGNYAEGGAYPCSEMLDNQTGIVAWNGAYNGNEFGKKWSADNVAIGSCSYMRGMGDIEALPAGGTNLTYNPQELWIEYSNDNITWLNFTNNLIDGNGTSQNDTRPGYQYLGSPTASYWTLLNFSAQETVMSIRMIVSYEPTGAATAVEEWECYEAGALPAPPGIEPRANITFDDLEGNGIEGLTCPFTTNAASYNYSATPYWNHTDIPTNLDLYINGTYYITNGTLLKNATQYGTVVNYAALNDNDYDLFFRSFMNTTGAYYTGNCTATSDRVLPNITAFGPTNVTDITAASLELAIYQEDTHLHNFTYCISNASLGTNCLAYNLSILDGNITWDTNDTTTNFTEGGTYWVNYTVCDDVNCVTEDIIFDYTVATMLGVGMLDDLTSQYYPQAVIAEYESDQGTANLSKWTIATNNASWSDRFGHEAQSFDDRMWIMGGVNTSVAPHQWLSDVWYSTNGIAWTVATYDAPWEDRQIFGSAVFDDKLWIFGGQNETDPMNDVWSSADGTNWVLVNGSAAFSRRHNFETLVFDNKIWIIGGANDSDANLEDVWYTSDGALWYPATYDGGFRGRTGFASTVHNSKMWVFGGTTAGVVAQDVWSSADGVTWNLINESAGWLNRTSPEVVTLGGMMWLSGGKGQGVEYYRDIWSSADGVLWTLQKEEAEFQNRTYHRMYTHSGRMWLTGGQNASSSYMSDVWYSTEAISTAIVGATCNATSYDGEGGGIQAMTYEAHLGRYQLNFTENLTDGSESRWNVQCNKIGYEYQTGQANDTVDHWAGPVDAESFTLTGASIGPNTGVFADYGNMEPSNPGESNVTGLSKCALIQAPRAANQSSTIKFVSLWSRLYGPSNAHLFLHKANASYDGTGAGRYPNPAVNISSCEFTKPEGPLNQYETCEALLEYPLDGDNYYYVCARDWGSANSAGVGYGNESQTRTSLYNFTGGTGTDWYILNNELALAIITPEEANVSTSSTVTNVTFIQVTVKGKTGDFLSGVNVTLIEHALMKTTGASGKVLFDNAIAGNQTYHLKAQLDDYEDIEFEATTHNTSNYVLVYMQRETYAVQMFLNDGEALEITSDIPKQTFRGGKDVSKISFRAWDFEGVEQTGGNYTDVDIATNCTWSATGAGSSYHTSWISGLHKVQAARAGTSNAYIGLNCTDGQYLNITIPSLDFEGELLFENDQMTAGNFYALISDNAADKVEFGADIFSGVDMSPVSPMGCLLNDTDTTNFNNRVRANLTVGSLYEPQHWWLFCNATGYDDMNISTVDTIPIMTPDDAIFDVADCYVPNYMPGDPVPWTTCELSTYSIHNASLNNMDLHAAGLTLCVDVSGSAQCLAHATSDGENYTYKKLIDYDFSHGTRDYYMEVTNIPPGVASLEPGIPYSVTIKDYSYDPYWVKASMEAPGNVRTNEIYYCRGELSFDGSLSKVKVRINTDNTELYFSYGEFTEASDFDWGDWQSKIKNVDGEWATVRVGNLYHIGFGYARMDYPQNGSSSWNLNDEDEITCSLTATYAGGNVQSENMLSGFNREGTYWWEIFDIDAWISKIQADPIYGMFWVGVILAVIIVLIAIFGATRKSEGGARLGDMPGYAGGARPRRGRVIKRVR